MSLEENKANLQRFVDEAFNRGILDIVDETRGQFAAASRQRITAFRTAFPDLSTTIEVVIGDGEWLAFRLLHRGTHLGEFRGIPPTGKRVEFASMVMNRHENGIVVENWGLHDFPAIFDAIGAGATTGGTA